MADYGVDSSDHSTHFRYHYISDELGPREVDSDSRCCLYGFRLFWWKEPWMDGRLAPILYIYMKRATSLEPGLWYSMVNLRFHWPVRPQLQLERPEFISPSSSLNCTSLLSATCTLRELPKDEIERLKAVSESVLKGQQVFVITFQMLPPHTLLSVPGWIRLISQTQREEVEETGAPVVRKDHCLQAAWISNH